MKPVTILSAALVLLSLSPALQGQRVTSQGGGADEVLDIQFDEINGTPLTDFLKLVQLELGQQIRFEPSDVGDLRIQALGNARVSTRDFRKFAEATLYSYGFVLVPYGDSLHLRSTNFGRGSSSKPGYLKAQAEFVPLDRLGEYEGRWVVVTTTIPLKHLNVQEFTNLLQSYFTDPMTESVRAVSTSNSVVITGFPELLLSAQKMAEKLDVPETATPSVPAGVQQQIRALESRIAELEKKVAALSKE